MQSQGTKWEANQGGVVLNSWMSQTLVIENQWGLSFLDEIWIVDTRYVCGISNRSWY